MNKHHLRSRSEQNSITRLISCKQYFKQSIFNNHVFVSSKSWALIRVCPLSDCTDSKRIDGLYIWKYSSILAVSWPLRECAHCILKLKELQNFSVHNFYISEKGEAVLEKWYFCQKQLQINSLAYYIQRYYWLGIEYIKMNIDYMSLRLLPARHVEYLVPWTLLMRQCEFHFISFLPHWLSIL